MFYPGKYIFENKLKNDNVLFADPHATNRSFMNY